MRIQCKPAIVLLCLWISAAHSQYSAVAPEDQDTSGDDQDFSGSGDEGSASQGTSQVKEIMWTQNVTLAVSNATETAWVTDAPVRIPELTTSQHSTVSDNMAQEPVATTPPLSTTIVLDNVEPPTTTAPPDTFQGGVLDDDTTTLSPSIEEETTALPVEETPAVPSIEEETTITSVVDKEPVEEESTTSSPIEEETDDGTTPAIILDEEDGTTVSVEVVDFATDEPDAKTTPLPQTTSTAADPALEDEVSGDGSEETPMTEFTTQGMGLGTEEKDFEEKNIIPQEKPKVEVPKPADGDFDFDNEIRPKMQKPLTEEISGSSDNENLLERTEVLAGVIAGGVVGLAFAIMLVSLMVYRMKKKDEGSYALDEHKHPNGGYQKAQRQEEFLA